ncbi:hypothetical protein SapgrDRAFT_2255 [Saprospira grandis DSM 2844]|uniref:Uncharacterized protein n=1 Tax=Saprospira grandis DSM 2844 TaxID=694433 RepID=J0P297_9BACT|nr:hypothetical protein [Saprospira grandis]EJF53929.1 hypothetical protein SapgrDRAFT_2255 [Saprospira grandis DSM 2844]
MTEPYYFSPNIATEGFDDAYLHRLEMGPTGLKEMSLLISGFFQEHMPFDPIPQIELKGQLDGNWEVDIPQFTDLSQGLDKEQLNFNWEEGSDFVEEMQQALAAGGQSEKNNTEKQDVSELDAPEEGTVKIIVRELFHNGDETTVVETVYNIVVIDELMGVNRSDIVIHYDYYLEQDEEDGQIKFIATKNSPIISGGETEIEEIKRTHPTAYWCIKGVFGPLNITQSNNFTKGLLWDEDPFTGRNYTKSENETYLSIGTLNLLALGIPARGLNAGKILAWKSAYAEVAAIPVLMLKKIIIASILKAAEASVMETLEELTLAELSLNIISTLEDAGYSKEEAQAIGEELIVAIDMSRLQDLISRVNAGEDISNITSISVTKAIEDVKEKYSTKK